MVRRGGRTLACLAFFLAGCDGQEDVDRLARLGRKVVEKLQGGPGEGGALSGPLRAVRGNWNELTLDARVSCRLRWDRDLEGASIRVRPAGAGSVELQGNVATLAQRQRAVDLARSTVGVNDVVDRLAGEGAK